MNPSYNDSFGSFGVSGGTGGSGSVISSGGDSGEPVMFGGGVAKRGKKWIFMDAYEKIRIIRQLSKRTQTEFGESLGLSKATISNFETGRVPIPNYVTILLKLLYNIDPDWLMNDDEEDLKKRFFDKNTTTENSMQSAFTEKFKNLNQNYHYYSIVKDKLNLYK